MSEREKDILSKIYSKLEGLEGSVETIRRGVYGDRDNNVLGLLQRQEIDEQERQNMNARIDNVEKKNWKISAVFGLVGGFLVYLYKLIMT